MKNLLLICAILLSGIIKAQYENTPDSIPTTEKILKEALFYRAKEKITINFNQYLVFKGVVVYNIYSFGERTMVAENPLISLSLNMNKESGLIEGRIITSDGNMVFELNYIRKGRFYSYWWYKIKSL